MAPDWFDFPAGIAIVVIAATIVMSIAVGDVLQMIRRSNADRYARRSERPDVEVL